MAFDDFFKTATTGQTPYAYQRRLACGEPSRTACGEQTGRAEAEWLTTGTSCSSQLISIPTGLGKTAALVLA